jgi:hypothetical protein
MKICIHEGVYIIVIVLWWYYISPIIIPTVGCYRTTTPSHWDYIELEWAPWELSTAPRIPVQKDITHAVHTRTELSIQSVLSVWVIQKCPFSVSYTEMSFQCFKINLIWQIKKWSQFVLHRRFKYAYGLAILFVVFSQYIGGSMVFPILQAGPPVS